MPFRANLDQGVCAVQSEFRPTVVVFLHFPTSSRHQHLLEEAGFSFLLKLYEKLNALLADCCRLLVQDSADPA